MEQNGAAAPPPPRRAGLYLDFDNVFSILAELDEAAALAFAGDPAGWLRWLAEGRHGGPPRRFRTLRAYMNAGGSVETRPDGHLARQGYHPRLFFSRFRQTLAWAGFETVDCPRVSRAKNAADVRMVIDVLDAVGGPAPPAEVVLLSSDSDFLPLLHRLRSLDVRTVVVAHPALGRAMRATADEVSGLDEFAAGALGWTPPPPEEEEFAAPPRTVAAAEAIRGDEEQPDVLDLPPPGAVAAGDPVEALREIALGRGGRVHLPVLGNAFAARMGYTLRESRYADHGTLEALLEAAGLRLTPGPGGGWVEVATAAGPEEG
jgi:hypothetical protein